jgi:hypothetical protein
LLARKYKELPEKEMRKWEKKAEQDKMRYQEEMKHYVPAEDPTGGKKGKKQKKVRKEDVICHDFFMGYMSNLPFLFILFCFVSFLGPECPET